MKIKKRDGILKIMVIIFLLITLGNTIEYFFINKSNLKHINGTVDEVILKTYPCRGFGKYSIAICEKTVLKLEGSLRSYVVNDYSNRDSYITGIQKGDKVSVYVRKWYQYFLTFGFYNDIYFLERDGELFYDIEKWKVSNQIFMIIFGSLSIVFGGLYILQRRTINQLMKDKYV